MKITVKLDKRYRLSNGKYPVKLSIARNGKTLYLPLGIEVREEDWDKSGKNQNYIKNVKERTALNMHIRSRLSQAEQTIRDLQVKGLLRRFDNKQLIAYLSSDRTNTEHNQFFQYQAEKCLEEKTNPDTVDTYESAIKALKKHYDYPNLLVQDIDRRFIDDFRKKLTDEGLKTNTIGNYILRIKAIYNFAYHNGDIDTPFPRIPLRKERTKKRSLLVEQIRLLKDCKATRIQRKHIDIFMLILYMRGINMKDLSELMVSDMRNGRIEYDRDKTGKHLEIKLEPEMMEIINKYKGREHLLNVFDGHSPEEKYHKRYGNNMRMTIRKACEKIGLDEKISAYWARHTWSSLAVEIGIDVAYVSAGLSHSHGEPITQVYIQYRQKKIDEDSRRVMDYILQKGEFSDKS
jgi:site-specific recombinase XerD